MNEKRSLLGPIEIVSIIAGLAILAYLGFKGGGKVAERTETVIVHDKPRDVRKKPSVFKDEAPDQSVEIMLQELADHFSDKSQSKQSKTATAQPTKQIPQDEAKFYDRIKEKESLSDKVRSTADWLRVLRASQKTYSKVRDILNESSDGTSYTDDLNEALQDESATDAFYRNLSDSFGISKKDIEAFGRKGKTAVSDWAEYIQENQKKE